MSEAVAVWRKRERARSRKTWPHCVSEEVLMMAWLWAVLCNHHPCLPRPLPSSPVVSIALSCLCVSGFYG